MAITLVRSEARIVQTGATTLATHTFATDIGDIIVNDANDNSLSSYGTTPATGNVWYNTSADNRAGLVDSFDLRFYANGTYIRRANYATNMVRVNAGINASIGRTSNWWASTKPSDFFNASNKTTASIPVYYRTASWSVQTVNSAGNGVAVGDEWTESANLGSINLKLNVPPTYDTTALSYTAPAYTGITTASVTVSNCTAYYGGDISSATLTIGNQTETISGDGTISMLLNEGGTFTPKVTVTDSRGQKKVTELAPLTVNVYTAPSATFTAQRTTQAGVVDDEGTYAVISTTLTFDDAIATALAPTVAVMDEGGTTTTPTVTWYTTRALTTTVTWANVSSGDTVYGLISGFNTQYSYQISVTPRDDMGTGTAVTETLASAFYTVDFLAGGHGIAFGQPASQEGFFCNMEAHFVDNNSVMRALFDFMYPVGSYYETSDTTFDPNVSWGGTWSLEVEGQVHISAGTNYTIGGALTNTTDGGSKDAVVVSHTHRIFEEFGAQGSGSYPPGGTSYAQIGSYGPYAGKIESTGESGTNKNMPPYIVVNRWHRTA